MWVLGWSGGGGGVGIRAEEEALQVLMTRGQDPDQFARAINPFSYDAGTSPQLVEEDTAVRRKWYASAEAYFAQLQAVIAWEAYSRLAKISAPTLVMHGANDRLVPVENGQTIAARNLTAVLITIRRG